jgi:chromosome segregation ATPase
MRVRDLTAVLGLLVGFMSAPVVAQTERSGNADARVMQQLQQLTAERAALQSENAKLQADLDRLKRDHDKLAGAKASFEVRAKALEANASRSQASGQQAEEQLERARTQLQELIEKFRETAQTLRDVETDRAGIRGQLATREREFKTCVDRNVALYELNNEVLGRLESRGFWANVGEREPFTRLKRVQMENLIEDYRYRVEELRLEQPKQAKQ